MKSANRWTADGAAARRLESARDRAALLLGRSSSVPVPSSRRVRIIAGPWPKRIGCEGVECIAAADGTYPQPGKAEMIVLLDDDPLVDVLAADFGDRTWSCCVSRRDVEYLGTDAGG